MRTLRPQRWRIAFSGLLGLVEVSASLGFVWMSKRVVDIATGALDAPLGPSVGVLAGIMALQVLCRVGSRWWESYIVVNAQNAHRAGVFEKVMRSTWAGKERLHSGDTVSRLEEDIRLVIDFTCVSIPACAVTLFQLIAASAYLFTLAPRLAWILILIMPVAVLGSRLFFRKMRELSARIRSCEGAVQGHMQENLQHRILVKTLGGVAGVLEKLGLMQKEILATTVTRANYNAVSRGFMQMGFAAGYALVFLWGVYGLRDGTVTYGTMVAFLQLVGQVQRPVAALAQQIPAFIRALASEERLMELEDDRLILGLKKLDEVLIEKNLSPGGAAETLALALLIRKIKDS